MIKKILLLAIIVFFTLSYGNTTIAKEKKAISKNKSAVSSKEKINNSPVTPFDMQTEKLPPNFKGTDIVKLYTIFAKKAPLEKAEFETTADYEKKIKAAVTDDVYAFKLKPEIGGIYGLTIQPYDADTQKLQINLETISLSTIQGYRASMIIKDIARGSRSYIGSNAFGAKVLVTSYRATQYGIVLVNQKDFGPSHYDDNQDKIKTEYTRLMESVRTINLEIKMPPEKAKTLKNNVGVLIVCKPALYKSNAKMELHGVNNLIFEDTYDTRATINNPTSLSYDRKFINVEVLAIWVYKINSGSILLKKQLKNKEDEQKSM